ncbi:glycosyltransferase [Pandoraea sputorum]|uniref:Putative glycosyl transferase n=1 Tax=Pandoraea sputorum TaxID=93222 RepID=A0A239T077_9BURK|nr:glycosyltransferase [Pandoraea sputorum]SNU90233.1 putative glycosyl transferase [Pandoraea sputorum]VVE35045.1 glycosyltransferase WbuB [Pandoraea sputorum]VVE84406.1 glycosyltransferase WbuB [Pandoraea sputorum]
MKAEMRVAKPLNVWIVNPYGTLPDEAWREYRSSMLASALRAAGHRVTWWISNFEHRDKRFRTPRFERRELADGTIVNIVPTTAYAGHISLARIKSEQVYARGVAALALSAQQDRPDLIVLAEPSLFFGGLILAMARRLGVPIVSDILDLWPELFTLVLPRPLRPLQRLVFAPLYWRRARTLRASRGIVAVSRDYLNIGLHAAPGKPSLVSYLGVDVASVRTAAKDAARVLAQLDIAPKVSGEIWVIYAGTLGENYDIASIIGAMEDERLRQLPVRFLFAGNGPQREMLRAACNRSQGRARYLGTLEPASLNALYTQCDIGLSTYLEGSTVSMPVKFYDYLAGGLAVVNSLGREIGTQVTERRLGLQYGAGDARSLADALVALTEFPELLAEYRRNASEAAMAFDQRAQHDRYVQFLTSLVENPTC